MPTLTQQRTGYATLTEKSFNRFRDYIVRELGIKMPLGKLPMLQSRLQRKLRQSGFGSIEAYQDYLFELPESAPEWLEFINLVTTNKTDFFREPKHFDYLVRTALPSMSNGDAWLAKVWCAGCSSGEEPYTLAMVLANYATPGFDFSILATDVSTNVLEHAAQAIYEETKVAPVPAEFRQRYLMRSKERTRALVRIVPELREKVRFKRLNFMAPDYGIRDTFDIIFFRNVMIYFDRPTQQQVLTKLCQQLRPGGYLFVGHSESLVGYNLPVTQVTNAAFRKTR
ncbi:MAG: CheR family methyltransferase [Verrucomicrobiota bacterium]|nr:CheR family methyltransferase [Verrucomicrobiota bacterium]